MTFLEQIEFAANKFRNSLEDGRVSQVARLFGQSSNSEPRTTLAFIIVLSVIL